eukprot:5857002-Amphidinium_carterae.1
MGAHPVPQEEVTADQLTAIKALLDEGLPPYVDMAVWRPYGLRMQKKIAFHTAMLTPGGSLRRTELRGPSNFSEWQESFRLLKTALISLRA